MYGVNLLASTNGRINNWATTFHNIEGNSHPWQWGQNVGKHDYPIGAKGSPGLERYFNGQIRIFRPLPEGRILISQITVNLHITTRLAHHPYWRTI
jgi:hypothetical protein